MNDQNQRITLPGSWRYCKNSLHLLFKKRVIHCSIWKMFAMPYQCASKKISCKGSNFLARTNLATYPRVTQYARERAVFEKVAFKTSSHDTYKLLVFWELFLGILSKYLPKRLQIRLFISCVLKKMVC